MISGYDGWWKRAEHNNSVMLGPPRVHSLDTFHVLKFQLMIFEFVINLFICLFVCLFV